MDRRVSAAFPLNTPLLPGMGLPLRLFEPRYTTMLAELLAGDDPSFVVSMIERGHEVGGGEERSDVGCVARIVHAEEQPDGTWSVLAAGTRRVRVLEWLDDAPYPRAVVEDWADPALGADALADLLDHIDLLELAVFELVALGASLGLPAPDPDTALSDDPGERVHQFAIISPLGAHDRQRLLSCPDLPSRVSLAEDLVLEQTLLLRARREFGEGGTPGT